MDREGGREDGEVGRQGGGEARRERGKRGGREARKEGGREARKEGGREVVVVRVVFHAVFSSPSLSLFLVLCLLIPSVSSFSRFRFLVFSACSSLCGMFVPLATLSLVPR